MIVDRILKQIEKGHHIYLTIAKEDLYLEIVIAPGDVSVRDNSIEVDGGKRKFTIDIDFSNCSYNPDVDEIRSAGGEIIIYFE